MALNMRMPVRVGFGLRFDHDVLELSDTVIIMGR
jgi:hypothetical protein